MSLLYCAPCVFAINNEYEILVLTDRKSIISVKVGDNEYYTANSGALSSEKRHGRIRVPKNVLDAEKIYTVILRESVDRRAYYSVIGETEEYKFPFRPVEKTNGINMYLISDVHYHFDLALKTATYFGDDLDVLLVNGDIGEVETEDNYREVAKFVSDITRGEIPAVFVRGNHDTRGKLAELYTDFFPSNGYDTYYTFDLGPVCGVAYDCGEDKLDYHSEYGGVNVFEAFRRRETAFFKSLTKSSKPTFAIGHMCPAQITNRPGSIFDVDHDVFTQWVKELERIGISFMLCGHIHRAYILGSDAPESLVPHNFPVIVGSACYFDKNEMCGTAITVGNGKAEIRFTNSAHVITEAHEITLK